MSHAPIDSDRAAEIAKRAAADRGRSWVEPTQISEHGDELHVSDNAEFLGGNILVVIDRITGQIRRLAVLLRSIVSQAPLPRPAHISCPHAAHLFPRLHPKAVLPH